MKNIFFYYLFRGDELGMSVTVIRSADDLLELLSSNREMWKRFTAGNVEDKIEVLAELANGGYIISPRAVRDALRGVLPQSKLDIIVSILSW